MKRSLPYFIAGVCIYLIMAAVRLYGADLKIMVRVPHQSPADSAMSDTTWKAIEAQSYAHSIQRLGAVSISNKAFSVRGYVVRGAESQAALLCADTLWFQWLKKSGGFPQIEIFISEIQEPE
ncbi:hypothetical protein LCGC14_1583630 [marine sediment metagenome]|uniref:Uncharacterized protein n=1 Tax=marine sediment metagenome TaxID=412755 RepID=A0A0F9IGE1_9ZZZZ